MTVLVDLLFELNLYGIEIMRSARNEAVCRKRLN